MTEAALPGTVGYLMALNGLRTSTTGERIELRPGNSPISSPSSSKLVSDDIVLCVIGLLPLLCHAPEADWEGQNCVLIWLI